MNAAGACHLDASNADANATADIVTSVGNTGTVTIAHLLLHGLAAFRNLETTAYVATPRPPEREGARKNANANGDDMMRQLAQNQLCAEIGASLRS